MLVPEFWAEGRIQKLREHGGDRQITVRRWGWSDESKDAAQRHADERVREAFERIVSGDSNLPRREPKVPYNGAEGVPIREEIVARHGETIITRNSYGALCLNTPRVLFADIDFDSPSTLGEFAAGCGMGLFVGLALASLALRLTPEPWATVAMVLGFLAGVVVGAEVPRAVRRIVRWLRGGIDRIAERRVRRFFDARPDWSGRLYRTPAGFRVLLTHATFDPQSVEAECVFDELGGDPVYAKMCRRQACFRARVSPKPWRAGIPHHLKPRPGTWPIDPQRIPDRRDWVERYEELASGFASCRYVDTLGSATTSPEALEVQRLHDELCKVHSDLPIA
ncbi:MAG: hypothetical protein AAF266_04165 [Planctomycetota bacterium]